MHGRASDCICSRVLGRRSDEPILVSGLIYMGPRGKLYWFTQQAILVHPLTNIASHYPPLWGMVNTFQRNKEASPQKKRREAL